MPQVSLVFSFSPWEAVEPLSFTEKGILEWLNLNLFFAVYAESDINHISPTQEMYLYPLEL